MGLQQCLSGMELLVEMLLVNGDLKYILTGRITQDCLESFFSQVRGKGGHRFNPTPSEFAYAYRALSTNLLLTPVKSANCTSDTDSLLVSLGALANEKKKRKRDVEAEEQLEEPSAKRVKLTNPEVVSIADFIPMEVSNIIAYIGGYVLRKRACGDCRLTKASGNVVTDADLFCPVKAYEREKSAFGSLSVPSDHCRKYLERVEDVFVNRIPTPLCEGGILSTFLDQVQKEVPNLLIEQELCTRHKEDLEHVSGLVKLYLRCRIHYYYKFQTRSLFLAKSKNRKAQVLSHQ